MYEEDYTEPEFMKRTKANPFRTPDNYFDSIEDSIMSRIQSKAKKKTYTTKIIQLLKPVLGVAASLTIIYLLVYHPVNHLLPKSMVKSDTKDTTSAANLDLTDAYALNISMADENSLVNAIFGNETTTTLAEINPDEVLAYLSNDMNDVEIYSEIQNKKP
jgi:hypothetical protein